MNERRFSIPFLAAILIFTGLAHPAGAQQAGDKTATDRTAGQTWLEAHRGPNQKQYVGEPIDLSLRDADLVETLRSFAELGRFNLVVQPGVQGKVTVELKQVPWDLALEQILKINNLGMEVTAGECVREAAGDDGNRRCVKVSSRLAPTR